MSENKYKAYEAAGFVCLDWLVRIAPEVHLRAVGDEQRAGIVATWSPLTELSPVHRAEECLTFIADVADAMRDAALALGEQRDANVRSAAWALLNTWRALHCFLYVEQWQILPQWPHSADRWYWTWEGIRRANTWQLFAPEDTKVSVPPLPAGVPLDAPWT